MAEDIGPKIGIDGEAKFRASINNISAALKALDAQMKSTTSAFTAQTAAEEKNKKVKEQLEKQLEVLRKAQEKANRNMEDAAKATTETSTVTLKARRQYEEVTARINETEQAMQQLTEGFEDNGAAVEEATGPLERYADTMATLQAADKVLDVLHTIGDGMTAAAESSIEFESAFTGVKKTVDGTPEQLAAISDEIKRMAAETGVSTTTIAAVAENAGQLGVATENIASFTRTMLDLGESTNLTADEAAVAIARLTNIMGSGEDATSRLGSSLVALGNNFATTESEILEMATRLASAGKLAGMSEAQILALATAMSSVGIEAEAGGTAMTQTLNAIDRAASSGGDTLETFARVADMSAEEFTTAWRTDAAGALTAFIQGLSALSAQGGSVTAILDDLGLSGIRQSNMLRSLALASDMMTDALETSNSAWAENVALANEANAVYGNTEHRISAARESINNLGIAIGDAFGPQISGGADMVNDLAQALTDAAETAPGLVSALGSVTVGITGAAAAYVALKAAATAFNAIGITSLSALGPLAAVGAAIGLITAGVTTAASASKKEWSAFVDAMMPATDTMEEAAAELEKCKRKKEELENQMGQNPGSTALRREYFANLEVIESLESRMADYASEQTGVTVAVDENTAAVALAAEQEAKYQEVMGGVTELLQKQQERYEKLRETYASTFGLFETAPELVHTSTADMISSLQSQEQYWTSFGENMKRAAELGIDDGLLQALASMGTEGAAYLQSILDDMDSLGAGSEESLQLLNDLNSNYQAAQEAQAQAAAEASDAIAQSSGEIDEAMRSMADAVKEMDKTSEMYETAEANIDSYLAGLEAQAGPMYEAVKAIGEKILSSMQAGINSGTLTLPGVSGGGFNVDGSHKTGLDYVPYDDYVAVLHKGEMVLPADDAADYRSGGKTGGASTTVNLYPQTVDEATIDYIYNRFSARMGAEI
nr:MAG TPA: minor tail protein [Caudoviricetes sp.]